MPRAAAEVGSTANSYQILAKLAAGGMAEIFLARGEGVAGVERHCVLKRILRERASDVQFVRMFLDEARLAAQLQHPNIAQVYDIGKLGDSYFFTMEYVHGETVRSLLHRALGLRRMLPIHGVLTIVAGAAAGLHHAHERLGLDGRPLGIVHRDVSPSNLMVSYEGGIKVVDFGVAKAADRAQETKSGTVKGKISYLSPEQCRGRRVDRRSDLFSLGICFWEMLTCERLYKRSSDFENMNAIVSEPVPAPSSRRPDVPPELDALVLRLLAKDVAERFQTADELIEAIEGVAARTQVVLSSSALGRFMRELFGQRPEPWLELEAQVEQVEAVTVTGEPIPPELALPPSAAIDRQLASVLDLSAHKVVTESVEALSMSDLLPVGSTRVGRLGPLGFPLAAPPPTNPGLAVTALHDLRGRSQLADAPPTATESLGEPADLPLALVETARASGKSRRPTPLPRAASEPPPLPPTPVPSVVRVMPALPDPLRVDAQVSGLTTTASGQVLTLPVPPPGAARAARRSWPLYAVIGGAAIAGSLAVVLAMRSGGVEPAASAGARPSAPSVRPEPKVVPIEAPPEPPVAEAPPAPPAPEVVVKPVAKESGEKPRATVRAKPVKQEDAVQAAFLAHDYKRVRALCGGPISAERAPMCVLAACHAGDAASATRALAAVSAAQRGPVTAQCADLGTDLAPKKPAAKPDDCEADPMACQH